jgi:hypothetical protein
VPTGRKRWSRPISCSAPTARRAPCAVRIDRPFSKGGTTQMRITIVALLALAMSSFAQGPGPGPGPGRGPGRRGFDAADGPGARFLGAEAGRPGRVVANAPYSADVVRKTRTPWPTATTSRVPPPSFIAIRKAARGANTRSTSAV